MPFVCAGAAVLLFALIFGMGSVPAYIVGAVLGAAGFMAGRLVFPDRTVEVEAAPKSGDAQVDALITEARTQLDRIAAANAGIADAGLTARIDDIEQTGRKILLRLEEQPGMLSQLRTFLRYYLPTTLKLLDARARLDDAGTPKGREVRRRIGSALSEVDRAFKNQVEALEEYRFVDLESEMDVLSEMLRADGLIAEEDGDDEEKPRSMPSHG